MPAEKFFSIQTNEMKSVWYDCVIEMDDSPTQEQMTDIQTSLRNDYDFEVLSLSLEWRRPLLTIQTKLLTPPMEVWEFTSIIFLLLEKIEIIAQLDIPISEMA